MVLAVVVERSCRVVAWRGASVVRNDMIRSTLLGSCHRLRSERGVASHLVANFADGSEFGHSAAAIPANGNLLTTQSCRCRGFAQETVPSIAQRNDRLRVPLCRCVSMFSDNVLIVCRDDIDQVGDSR